MFIERIIGTLQEVGNVVQIFVIRSLFVLLMHSRQVPLSLLLVHQFGHSKAMLIIMNHLVDSMMIELPVLVLEHRLPAVGLSLAKTHFFL